MSACQVPLVLISFCLLQLEQKQKYAVWKAGDIRKALKEGRTPTPGPPGGDENIRKQFGSAASTSLNAGPGGPAGVPPQAPAFPQGAPSAPAPAFDAFGLPAAPSLAPSLSGRTPPAAGAPPAAPAGRWAQPPSQGAPEGSYGAPSSTGYQGNGPQGFGGLPNGQPTQPAPQFPHLDPANAPSSQPPSSLPYAHPVAPPAYPQASAPSAPPFGGSVPSHQGATTGGAFGLPSGTQALQFATAVPGGGSFYDGQAPSAPAPPPSTSSSAPSGADVSHVTAQASSMSLGSSKQAGTKRRPSIPFAAFYVSAERFVPLMATCLPRGGTGLSAFKTPWRHHSTCLAVLVLLLFLLFFAAAAPAPAPTPAFSSSGVQPTPGKVAEAHKSARFAVSALAFDDVPTAIEYLRKSLDLLTKP